MERLVSCLMSFYETEDPVGRPLLIIGRGYYKMTNREAMSLLTDEQIESYISFACCQKYACHDCPFRDYNCGIEFITSFLKEDVSNDHCKAFLRSFGIPSEKLASREETYCHEAIDTMLSEV